MTEINLDEEIEFYFEELLEYDSLPDHTLKTIYATGFKDCLRMLSAKGALKMRVEKMKKQQEELEVLEEYINDIPLILDPCRLCENKKQNEYQAVCSECMYYYGSNFKVKRILGKEIKGANKE